MDIEHMIQPGDIVRVNFHGAQATLSHRANVIAKPVATGDSWIFQDINTKEVHYVSEGCTVTKL